VYESSHQPLLHRRHFLRRVTRHALVAAGLIAFSIALGMAGYMSLERLPWTDAFLETAMLLGGMGPIHAPATEAGKLFAGLFALYAGLVFIATAVILLGPVVHRLLHRFHLERTGRDG
jgi:hypothetical protein